MTDLDLNPQTVCGVLLTHEHIDHVKGAPVFCRETGAEIMATQGTINGGSLNTSNTHILECATTINHQGFGITPLEVSHDTNEPCAFLIEVGGVRTLFLTDLGTAEGFDISSVKNLDYLYIEANHDDEMLRRGPYPEYLKQRISGAKGHLSNLQCGELVRDLAHQSPKLRAIMLAHLSDKNNEPGVALETVREYAGDIPNVRWIIARQEMPVALT